jgi:hypothetical protein
MMYYIGEKGRSCKGKHIQYCDNGTHFAGGELRACSVHVRYVIGFVCTRRILTAPLPVWKKPSLKGRYIQKSIL